MGLSRLDNFLKSVRGTIIYVDPNSLDSTDSIENSGNSLTRPFKTIQRALIEAARFSYQRGRDNDRFNKTTILLYPGDHIVDNRPGYIPTGPGTYSTRAGNTNLTDLTQWDLTTIFDLSEPNNPLYKLNSVHGGVIVPRGTSIVGLDLRKTRIRPTFVPNPSETDGRNVDRSAIFRVTGACYFWQFTILDADPNGLCYKDYSRNRFVPNFSHHKLSVFEYADGVNTVRFKNDLLIYDETTPGWQPRTDLDMYYEKVAAVYGPSTGDRKIEPDYGFGTIDIEPVVDEYRIVGSKGASVGISSIRAGNGSVSTNIITVNFAEPLEGISVDSPIQISGVNSPGYDGQFVVYTSPSNTQITYRVQNSPSNPLPGVNGASLNLVVDTVTSASPYIFNCSLRSVYGMCGLLADGSKATGFKSMVVAQYTGIGLQKDDNAFTRYNKISGQYEYSNSVVSLHTDSRSRFKPSYENFHIKATNDAFLQLVSIFAIGYAQHFVAESGGDIAINNSNSNFGAKAFVSKGYKNESFSQDDYGYITHIIPPKEIESKEISVEFTSLDVGLTTQRSAGAATTDRLYLYNETNRDLPPKVIVDGYHVGAKQNDLLNVQIFQSETTLTYTSRIVMPFGPYNSVRSSSEKIFRVGRSSTGINNIDADGSNIITLTTPHSFINGESVRIISENGHLPDGLKPDEIYYVSTVGIIENNQIRISKTLNDAINGNSLEINNKGGQLSVVSKVVDKNPGDIGHPVQWEGGYWYINVDPENNKIYDTIRTSGISKLGEATPRTYVTRKPQSRKLNDTLYRVRYVLPKDSPTTARPPLEGFILQESNNILGQGTSEISQLFNTSGSITNSIQLRNPRFIASASWSSNIATIRTELPHNLKVGDQVEIVNVIPSSYNGSYIVTSTPSSKEFRYQLNLESSPTDFANNTSARTQDLPYFKKKRYSKTYQVYRVEEVREYVPLFQDGIYYLTLLNCSNKPTLSPFREESFIQPTEKLYPQINVDNPLSDPDSSISHALPDSIGEVVVNDSQNSITKETIESFAVGYAITNITSTSGTNHVIYTTTDHRLSGISGVSIVNSGSAYGNGSSGTFYNAQLVGFAGSTTGSNATAVITINSSGSITNVRIIDGGSAYGIGNTLMVVGIATTTDHITGVVRVDSVFNNVDDTIEISGITSSTNSEYNTLYRVESVTTGRPKEINVISSETISNISSSGLGITVTSSAGYIPTGKSIVVSSFVYNSTTGLATVEFITSHGFRVDNKIRISGANESVFNGDFIVKKINNLQSLIVNVGVTTTSTTGTGSIYAYRPALSSYGGELLDDTESFSGRLVYEYAGITTVLSTPYSSADSDESIPLTIPNAASLGLNLGDYLLVNNEIFRIRTVVSSNFVSVYRSVLGSPRQSHVTGTVVRKIRVIPVELRRNSIIRASGHTFEYLGFGPGNYSTALPDKQNRVLSSSEKLLSQSTKYDGGVIVYTGMNSDGDFFSGNRKINSTTGKEETYDAPIPTKTSDKDINSLVNITDTQKIFVENSIKVDGGKDQNSVSEFDGPVVFNNKLTANSNIESNSIFLQGEEEVSRRLSVANEKPTFAGSYGDIIFNSEPSRSEFVGWTYVTENRWEPFGFIGNNGVGIASAGSYIGIATLINLVATGFTFGVTYDNATGISTLTWNANPLVAISSGPTNTLVGNFRQLNFVGGGVTVLGNSTVGIATIQISGSTGGGTITTPGQPYGSIQWNNNDNFAGIPFGYYNNITNNIVLGSLSNTLNSIYVNSEGSVGFASTQPSAKVDIFADNETALYIRSTSGSGNIVRIDDNNNDVTPFIIDVSGNVGINTESTVAPLDVVGNAAITGEVRLYESDRSNYTALRTGSILSNLLFTLPTSYGASGQVLTSNGSGVLSWSNLPTPTTSGITGVAAGTGINVTNASGPTVTISNNGVTKITAGTNVTISPAGGTGDVTINANANVPLYPFTTRGFSMPI